MKLHHSGVLKNVLILSTGIATGSTATFLYFKNANNSSIENQALQHPSLKYGLPSTLNLKVREGYVACYDRRTRNPLWVSEYITSESINRKDGSNRKDSDFKTDKSTPDIFQVKPSSYANSGYDRGHLAPARDMAFSQKAMNESFLMTNVSPQIGKGFNRGYWSRFEGFVRHLANQFESVYVVTGPLFLPQKVEKCSRNLVSYEVIGTSPSFISVPTHFFKVVLVEKKNGDILTQGFVLPNKAINEKTELTSFCTSIQDIEKYSGLVFFESAKAKSKYKNLELCKVTQCKLTRNKFARVKGAN